MLTKIISELITEFSALLYLDTEEVNIDKPFQEMGLDSILGVELIKTLNRNYQLDIKASKLYEYPTICQLAGFLEEALSVETFLETPVETIQSDKIFKLHQVEGDFIHGKELTFQYRFGIADNACLRDHLVFGKCVLPTDAFIELVYASLREYFGVEQVLLKNIKINQSLTAVPGEEYLVQVNLKELNDGALRFTISSGAGTIHLKGFVELDTEQTTARNFQPEGEPVFVCTAAEFSRLLPEIRGIGIYSHRGAPFYFHASHAAVKIDFSAAAPQTYLAELMSVGLACAMSYAPYRLNKGNADSTWLPYEIEEVSIFAALQATTYNCVVYAHEDTLLSFAITDQNDQPVLYIGKLQLKPVVKERPAAITTQTNTDVAIIGMSGRFPKAQHLTEFWENLKNGVDAIEEISTAQWPGYDWYHEEPYQDGRSYSKWGGFITDTDKFDPLFFGISPAEAIIMDPQQRLYLEECWKTMEDAGYSPKALNGKKVGVFVGVGAGDYLELLQKHNAGKSGFAFAGSSQAILAARISYFLNLTGPALAIDTACSSALVAIDRAYQSILCGESEMALAGGISLMTTPLTHIWTSQVGMPSADGRCHTFDDEANGIVSGEGVGVILLKSLAAAERDGDQILAVIKGSGINQDGRTNGMTAPNARAQRELQSGVYEKYKIDPATITYVEAHGTGTKLGDPIEVDALNTSFSKYTSQKNHCAIGSVKTNIGHVGFAAGVSGLMKCILMLRHGTYVPSLHYQHTNKEIDFSAGPFYVNTTLKEWPVAAEHPRRAAVNSFGFSGTNAHIVLEEYTGTVRPAVSTAPAIVVLSAKNKERLQERVADLHKYLSVHSHSDIYSISYTLQTGRESMEERLAIVCTDIITLRQQLDLYLSASPGTWFHGNIRKNKTDFVLDGGAGQAYINYAVTHKESTSLARLWVNGVDIDWSLLYEGARPGRISLPVYPFARERYWIAPQAPRPFVHTSVFTGTESFLADHQVNREKIFPATAYIDLLCEIGQKGTGKKINRLSDLSWQSPIRVNGTPATVRTRMEASGEGVIFTEIEKGEQVHCLGKVESVSLTQPRRYDLTTIQARLENYRDGKDCYDIFDAGGFHYGKTFRGLRQVYYSGTEALSSIVLKGEDGHQLSPGVLDSALQTCICLGFNDGRALLQLPFSVSEINIHAGIPENFWCYVQKKGNSYDVALLNHEGEVLVEFRNFVAIAPKTVATTLLLPVWKRVKLQVNNNFSGSHLLLGDAEFAASLGAFLRAGGAELTAAQASHIYLLHGMGTAGDPVIALFNTIKELLAQGYGDRTLHITCFTRQTQQVLASDVIDTYGAGIRGLIGSLAKEYPNWQVRMIDLDAHTPAFDKILQAPFDVDNTIYGYRNGAVFAPHLYPAALPAGMSSQFRQGGVYVILGGAGGLGQVTTSYLVSQYKAKVICLGRRPLGNIPGAEYIQCDATDKASVEAAFIQIKEKFPEINGLFHSAIVLNDMLISKMSEADFKSAYIPKSLTSQYLMEVFGPSVKDFICFYSSVQSHFTAAGQSNYAAGCTYKDSYARSMESRLSVPVYTINWGYWGDTGVVAAPYYRERMTAMGIGSISAEEGMQILEQTLSGGKKQVAAIKFI